jgi:group I intron endonuclease
VTAAGELPKPVKEALMEQIVPNKKQLRLAGVYGIANTAGICKYVGQTYCFEKRWREHKWSLKRGDHPNGHLQHAWNKYGERHFRFVVLEFCQIRDLDERERFWMDSLNPEYNIIRDISEWNHDKYEREEQTYIKTGESFTRPAWHLWVYGGHRKNTP